MIKEDVQKLLRWIRIRELLLNAKNRTELKKEETAIHLYFKENYNVRLFETEYDIILNKIFERNEE